MEKFLKPERLDTNPDSPTAAKEYTHWKRTFTNFLGSAGDHPPDKLNLLINFVSPPVYEYIAECDSYDTAMTALDAVYIRPKNEVLARHLLATRRQQSGETLEQFLQNLKVLAKDCNFKNVTADKYKEEYIRDAFITGLSSHATRQRLLENKTLDLKTMFDQARTLELAQRSNEVYGQSYQTVATASVQKFSETENSNSATISSLQSKAQRSRIHWPLLSVIQVNKSASFVEITLTQDASVLQKKLYVIAVERRVTFQKYVSQLPLIHWAQQPHALLFWLLLSLQLHHSV